MSTSSQNMYVFTGF